MSSTKFKKDKEIIGDYETQVKGAPPKCVLCVRVRACACRVDVCIVPPPPLSVVPHSLGDPPFTLCGAFAVGLMVSGPRGRGGSSVVPAVRLRCCVAG